MKIFKNKRELIKEISKKKAISFIPTMGSIHNGHLSLINKAKRESKNVLVSIYVNPKQFGSRADFKKYPRNINNDIRLLKKIKVKYLYIPNKKDIYSFKTKSNIYVDKFSHKLCGKFRPGHFKGVLNVVNRFLEIIKPKFMYLGMKDYQQVILIKSHINKNNINTKIKMCTTIREKNGVALSSRNIKLNKSQIKIAAKICKYLRMNKRKILLKTLDKKKQKYFLLLRNLVSKKLII